MTDVLTFNSIPLVSLCYSGATHSFTSSKVASQIGLKLYKYHIDLYVNWSTGKTVKHDVMYKNYPISPNQEEFEGDLIQLNLSEIDIILGMDWLSRHGAKIDCQKQ